jgi:glycosyltransferase involved in cell wall biosynthesis
MPGVIRCVHLSTDLEVAGAEAMLEKLVTRMDARRFENVIVSLTRLGPIGERLVAAGFRVHAAGLRPGDGAKNLGRVVRLLSLLRRLRPHVLQSWLYHADLCAALAKTLGAAPVLAWNVRCSNMALADGPRSTRWIVRINAALSRIPDVIIVNSEVGRSVHERLGYSGTRTKVIPNGFDLDHFRPHVGARARLLQMVGAADNTIIVGMVARFHPMKAHQVFFDAAARLADRHPSVRFVLAGHDVEWSNHALVGQMPSGDWKSHVSLLGHRSDLHEWIGGLDILCLPSLYGEGFPNIVGEAMASGVPCVVTDVGDAGAIVADTGAVVPPGDARALEQGLGRLVGLTRAARQPLGERARQRVEAHYEIGGVVRQFENLYESLARS